MLAHRLLQCTRTDMRDDASDGDARANVMLSNAHLTELRSHIRASLVLLVLGLWVLVNCTPIPDRIIGNPTRVHLLGNTVHGRLAVRQWIHALNSRHGRDKDEDEDDTSSTQSRSVSHVWYYRRRRREE